MFNEYSLRGFKEFTSDGSNREEGVANLTQNYVAINCSDSDIMIQNNFKLSSLLGIWASFVITEKSQEEELNRKLASLCYDLIDTEQRRKTKT